MLQLGNGYYITGINSIYVYLLFAPNKENITNFSFSPLLELKERCIGSKAAAHHLEYGNLTDKGSAMVLNTCAENGPSTVSFFVAVAPVFTLEYPPPHRPYEGR